MVTIIVETNAFPMPVATLNTNLKQLAKEYVDCDKSTVPVALDALKKAPTFSKDIHKAVNVLNIVKLPAANDAVKPET